MTYLLLQTFLLLLAAYFAGAFTACLIRRATMARVAETVAVPMRDPGAIADTPAYADLSHHQDFEHLEPRPFERVQPRIDILQRPEPRPTPAIADIARFDRALSGPDPNEGMPRISVVEVRPAVFTFVTGPALPWPPPRPPEPEPVPEPEPEPEPAPAFVAEPEPEIAPAPARAEAPSLPIYTGYAAAHAAAAAAAATASHASAATPPPVEDDTTEDVVEVIDDDADAPVAPDDAARPVTEATVADIEVRDDDDADDGDTDDDESRDEDDARDDGRDDDDDDEPFDNDDDRRSTHGGDDDIDDDDDTYDDDFDDDDDDRDTRRSFEDDDDVAGDASDNDDDTAVASLVEESVPAPAPHISAGDDLQRIRAIDADMEQKLKTNGVMRFIDIAKWTPDEIELIDVSLDLDGRIDREQWVEQAQILAKGGETYYSRNRAAAVRATSAMSPQSAPSGDSDASAGAGNPADVAGAAPTLEGGSGSSGKSVAELAAAAAAAIAAASASVTRGIKPIEPISPLSKVNPNIAIPARITDAIKAREQAPAAPPQPQPQQAPTQVPEGEGDDLKRIRGVGVLIAKRLNALGITHYEQIANWSNADVDRISKQMEFGNRIEREGWIQQARILASGGQTEFSRRFDRGEAD